MEASHSRGKGIKDASPLRGRRKRKGFGRAPPPVPISSGHPPPSKGEEKEEKTLGGTPTATPPVGAASPLEGEAERGQGKRLCFRLLAGSEGK